MLAQLVPTYMFAPAVRVVPLAIDTAPLKSSVAGAVKLPVVRVREAASSVVVEPDTESVWPAVFSTTIALKVWLAAVPLMAEAEPSKWTVPELWVNVPPLLVQFPPTYMFAPAVRVVPLAIDTAPLKSRVAGAVKLPVVKVREAALSVVVDPDTDSVWPAVFSTAIALKVWLVAVPLMAALEPLNVTVPEPGVNVPPLLVQLPARVIFLLFVVNDAPLFMVKVPFRVRLLALFIDILVPDTVRL